MSSNLRFLFLSCFNCLVFAFPSITQSWAQIKQTKPLPAMQRWQVNDTLVLECSRPLARFNFQNNSLPAMLWGRAVLKGKHGYRQNIYKGRYCTLYGVAVSPRGDVMRLALWSYKNEWMVTARKHPHQIIEAHEDYEFDYCTWDVRNHTASELMDADLRRFVTEEENFSAGFEGQAVGFTGGMYDGKAYHLLPYWIAKEKARLTRTHQLPSAELLETYIQLGIHCVLLRQERLPPAYRLALEQLLHAYQTYPLPSATAHNLQQALSALKTTQLNSN